MPSAQALLWLERLVWTLIYGGLFTAVLGLAVQENNGALGLSLMIVGGFVAAAGVVLIWIRSRLHETDQRSQ